MKAKRIVFKVGTSSLTNPDGSLSRQKVKIITQQLALLHESGHELILVSSGAVAAGFGALGFKKRPTKVADKQASAAVGQCLLMEEYTANLLLRNIFSAQILLTLRINAAIRMPTRPFLSCSIVGPSRLSMKTIRSRLPS